MIVNAVDYLKNQTRSNKDSSKTKSRHIMKHPCGICHKTVDKKSASAFENYDLDVLSVNSMWNDIPALLNIIHH